jgi:hypothetical protein
VLADIDYTTTITRVPYGFCAGCSISGPDITFFLPGAAGIPVPEIVLPLERFGGTGLSVDGANNAERYLLQNVTFQNGAMSASDSSFKFFYDSGTNLTIIDDDLKTALGLPATGSFNCFGGTSNGFNISSVTMTGIGGSYLLNNASLCASDSNVSSGVNAVIGSNFFSQVELLFDGPGNTLGIFGEFTSPPGEVIPEPSTVVLLGSGIAGLMLFHRRARARHC